MTERKILYTCKNLIAAGEDRKDIRIKEMKLCVKLKEVPLQEIQNLLIRPLQALIFNVQSILALEMRASLVNALIVLHFDVT